MCTESLGDLPGLWCGLCQTIDLFVLVLSVSGVYWSRKLVCFLSVVPGLYPTLSVSVTARRSGTGNWAQAPGVGLRQPSWECPSPRTSSSLTGWLGEPSSSALGFQASQVTGGA